MIRSDKQGHFKSKRDPINNYTKDNKAKPRWSKNRELTITSVTFQTKIHISKDNKWQ